MNIVQEFENNDLKLTTYKAIFQVSGVANHGYTFCATKGTKAFFS